MGVVVDGGSPDVAEAATETTADDDRKTTPSGWRRALPSRSAEPLAQRPRRRHRRTPTSALFGFLKRAWIPLVIVVVLIVGGFTVSRLQQIFGTVNSMSYGDTVADQGPPIDPKYLRYEVFGPPGAVAQISYFDENGNPKFIKDVPLPWSTEFPITTAAGVGSIAANADSEMLGCRILVDDVVKTETIKRHPVSTFTSCMLKGA